MPYQWSGELPEVRLDAWPYRSLPRAGFVAFIGATSAFLALPLLAVLGSPLLWGLLPFLAATVWGLWTALSRSYRSGALLETLIITSDRVHLLRREPNGQSREWEVNTHWLRVELHPNGYPVANYITLAGGQRTVELGAFLTSDERRRLSAELDRYLRELRGAARNR